MGQHTIRLEKEGSGHRPVERSVLVDRPALDLSWELPQGCRGRLLVRTEPTGAAVSVGTETYGDAPAFTRVLDCGLYPVTATMPSYAPASAQAQVTGGPGDEVMLRLSRASPPRTTVAVTTTSSPLALVMGMQYMVELAGRTVLNWQYTGATERVDLPAGEHRLRIVMRWIVRLGGLERGDAVHEGPITLPAGRPAALDINFNTGTITMEGREQRFNQGSWQNYKR